jgi:pilus assembly protein Flp/PilA
VKERIRRSLGRLQERIRTTDGQALVEYALILALVAVVVVAALSTLGGTINNLFRNVTDNLNA